MITRQPLRRTRRQVELLGQLVTLMSAEGFADFTLDDLAARLRCSKTTLYALAPTKHELVVQVVTEYFRGAAPAIQPRVDAAGEPAAKVEAYLLGVADYLAPLSRAFLDDMAAFAPTAAVYRRNTAIAAEYIRELIADGIASGAFRAVRADFVAEVVVIAMHEIRNGEMFARLEMSDAEAYAELASLVLHSLR